MFGVRISHFRWWRYVVSTIYLLGTLAYSIHPTGISSAGVFRLDLRAYPDELNERIVNPRSVWKPEATARAKLIKEK